MQIPVLTLKSLKNFFLGILTSKNDFSLVDILTSEKWLELRFFSLKVGSHDPVFRANYYSGSKKLIE